MGQLRNSYKKSEFKGKEEHLSYYKIKTGGKYVPKNSKAY